jgi:hypothetical protein
MRAAFCALPIWLAVTAPVHAQGTGAAARGEHDCSQWLARKGYSVDYIEQRTGKRPRGMADTWRGNVDRQEVEPGDVVLTPIRDKGRRLHASYVEEVRRNTDGSVTAVMVTEWNLGKYVDEACLATDHFGRDSGKRPVPIELVVRVWRPSLPVAGPPVE